MSTDNVVEHLLQGLREETDELLRIVGGLTPEEAGGETPAPGWTIHDQIGHLWVFDRVARIALTSPTLFIMLRRAAASDPGWVDALQDDVRALVWPRLLTSFAGEREALVADVRESTGTRVEWFGPDMSLASFVSARTMETWAHGQDCADALASSHHPTSGLRQVCDLGFRTIRYAFANRSLPAPRSGFRVELEGPDGEQWVWGEATAGNRVQGSATGFALLATRRRSASDSGVSAAGPDADTWLQIAQCYAGPAGPGRSDGQFNTLGRGCDSV